MRVDIPGQARGGRHRRHDDDVAAAAARYEQLVVVLHRHRPGERAGLCLVCGVGWPCREVLEPLSAPQRGQGEWDEAGSSVAAWNRNGLGR